MSARAALAVAGIVVELALVGACDAQSAATAISDPTLAPVTDQWRRDSIYLTAMRAREIEGTDGELLDTARNICRGAYEGRTLVELIDSVQARRHVSTEDATFVVGLAERTQCPEYTP